MANPLRWAGGILVETTILSRFEQLSHDAVPLHRVTNATPDPFQRGLSALDLRFTVSILGDAELVPPRDARWRLEL